MKTPQTAILPDNINTCIVIEAKIHDDVELKRLKDACCRATQYAQTINETLMPKAGLGLSIGFGKSLWEKLRPSEEEGDELVEFTPLGDGLAPATQQDIAFHVQSVSQMANIELVRFIAHIFAPLWQVAHETHGFRLHEDRGWDGFVDGTANPKDDLKQHYGIISEGAGEGGSYLLLQKYRHRLAQWNQLSDEEQSHAVGRSKQENEEFPGEQRLPRSHLGRTDLKEGDVALKILRRSLSYGTVTGDEQGLMFIAYSAKLHSLSEQLRHMFGEFDGEIDLLLEHLSQAMSGAYYYVPARETLLAWQSTHQKGSIIKGIGRFFRRLTGN